MAKFCDAAVMTPQRALRELQNLRLIYACPGKCAFEHPDAFDVLQGTTIREPIADPDLQRSVGDSLVA